MLENQASIPQLKSELQEYQKMDFFFVEFCSRSRMYSMYNTVQQFFSFDKVRLRDFWDIQ